MATSIARFTSGELANIVAGQLGWDVFADTSEHTPGSGKIYTHIHCIEATTFHADTAVDVGSAPDTSATYAADTVITGRFTTVKLASGTVHCAPSGGITP